MSNHGNLMNTFSDYLIYDERKGRVLHTRYLTKAQHYQLWRFHFNRLRPEFSDYQKFQHQHAIRNSRLLMNNLKEENLNQLRRCTIYFTADFPNEQCQKILFNHLNYLGPSVSNIQRMKMISWEDATRTAHYMQKVNRKIEKYGLQYPKLTPQLTQEQKTLLEEQIFEHFKTMLNAQIDFSEFSSFLKQTSFSESIELKLVKEVKRDVRDLSVRRTKPKMDIQLFLDCFLQQHQVGGKETDQAVLDERTYRKILQVLDEMSQFVCVN